MEYKKILLPNGLRLITVPMEHVQSVTVMILVGAGSRYEKRPISGLSHFLEHMAFKGTEKRPSAFAISSEIEGIGGEFNAFTSKDQTAFYVKAASPNLPVLIDVLSDMLLNSQFDKEEIDREKGVIIEEINLYEDTPSRKIGEIFEELLYGDTPLGWDIAGRKETIAQIQRADFMEYINGLYAPENTVVVIAGGISRQEPKIKDLVVKSLGGWQNKKTWTFLPALDKQDKAQAKIVYKKTEQAHLVLGVRGYNLFHADRYALGILATILGGGMSSRLFIQVRERRGLAYYVHSVAEHYADVGHLVTLAGVDLEKIEEAIRVILEEYRKVSKAKDISQKELIKAKEFLKGRLILELEDSRFTASIFGSGEILENRVKTPEEMMEKIDRVKKEDIQRVADDVFREAKLNLAVIGPFKDGQKFKNLLKL
ncbi:MAG: insulinase family protein [Patescibacteria group bacterium]|nr:insulinase family protein [Patescibacteria group bacterium]MCL5095266.1 insulinase family protein [Patescibacteria group bacterium]